MERQEVFHTVIKVLIEHFPHALYHLAMACDEKRCCSKDCRMCYFRRPQISSWEVSCILPDLEQIFGRKCPLNPPEFYDVVKFYTDESQTVS